MKKYQQFIFHDYHFDPASGVLDLHYKLDDKIIFTETYTFGATGREVNSEALDRACFGLFMIAGVSYYKTYLPDEIVINKGQLTPDQAAFFGKLYRHGLGEMYVRNELTPPEEIVFPSDNPAITNGAPEVANLKGALLPIGGGKDSIVTAELLEEAGKQFTTWTVAHSNMLQPLLDRIGHQHLAVGRILDSQLVRLNQEGAYNGHVPISAILAFTGVISALLSGHQDIVLSNEASAGEGNMERHGLEVNHQYSKTLEFECDFQKYVADNITPSVRYFSMLRPCSELRIAELFCNSYLDKYVGVFTSCNRNFCQGNDKPLTWCGECPKCAFVFLVFAPFLPKSKLVGLFGGKNLFADPKLYVTYKELLGTHGHKPFDCVGEIRECRQAVVMARVTGEWPELDKYTFPAFEYTFRALGESAMPPEYAEIIEKATS